MDISDDHRRRLVKTALLLARRKLGEGASLLDAAGEVHNRTSAEFREKWETTRNPVWVIRCLTRLNAWCVEASNFCPQLQGREFVLGIPEWVERYLVETAYRLESLFALRDFRTPPDALEKANGKPVTVEQATRLAVAALGITRKGWNGIREYQSEEFPRLWLEVGDLKEMDGRPRTLTNRKFTEAKGWDNERTAQRRLSNLRRRGGGAKRRV